LKTGLTISINISGAYSPERVLALQQQYSLVTSHLCAVELYYGGSLGFWVGELDTHKISLYYTIRKRLCFIVLKVMKVQILRSIFAMFSFKQISIYKRKT
jgi:hypothetical protein